MNDTGDLQDTYSDFGEEAKPDAAHDGGPTGNRVMNEFANGNGNTQESVDVAG